MIGSSYPSVSAAPVDLRTRKKELVRVAISDAALELFARDGFDATTVPAIARHAGVSPATVARYFPSKESLLFPDRDERISTVRAAILARPGNESPWRAVAAALTEQPLSLTDDEHRRLLRSRQAIARSSVLRGRASGLLDVWRDMIADSLSERDALTDEEARVVAIVFVAVLDDVAARWAANGGDDDLQAALRRALAVLVQRRST